MDAHPDHRYIVALKQQDNNLIREVYERFSGIIKQLVMKNSGTEDDANDVMQESLLTINRQATQNNLVLTCPFGAYLYRVARGRWLNELKKKHRHSVTIDDVDGFSMEEADAIALAEQTQALESRENLFWEKFQQLGDRCRELLQLSWQGNPMEKVAQLMGVTYGYARKKKVECIARLIDLVQSSREFLALRNE